MVQVLALPTFGLLQRTIDSVTRRGMIRMVCPGGAGHMQKHKSRLCLCEHATKETTSV
jgi:hypothetical protein